jgi:threonine synthase
MSTLYYVYACINCQQELMPDRPYYTCPACGGLLLIKRDEEHLRQKLRHFGKPVEAFRSLTDSHHHYSGVWRWADFILPGFPKEMILTLGEGQTGLWRTPGWLAEEIGLDRLWIKNEGKAPSGSFKDRGMPVAISEALRLQRQYPELGIKFVACASTGDTSASAAMYCAYVRDRLRCIVLVPDGNITPAQGYQVADTGAIVLALKAKNGFDGCMAVVQPFTAAHPEIVLVNSKNPLRLTGQETISLEIFSDLGRAVPDWLAVPVGNGGNVAAQMSAWLLLKEIAVIDRLPGIIIAQARTANTVVRWIRAGFRRYEPGAPGKTMASAMNIQDPVSQPRIEHLRAQFDVRGFDVGEEDIAATRARFNRAGAGLCTQGGVTLNAVLQARAAGVIAPKQTVVALNTANDLKFVEAGVEHHQSGKQFSNRLIRVEASLEAVEKAVAGLL